nr:DMT family transporter [Leucobacter weissii]
MGSGFAGMLVAVQSRVNGGLSQELGDGYLTAAVSFSSGLAILVLIVILSRDAKDGFRRLRAELGSRRLPWWALTGGACGAFFVLGQGLVASVIGLALFTVGIVAGQVFGGLVMDRLGLGPGGRVDPTPQRVIGTVLAIVAVALSVLSDFGGGDEGHGSQLWLMLLPLISGALVAWQSAVNGLVRAAAQSAVTSTFVNFVVGTAILVVAASVSVAVGGWPETWPSDPLLYIGGATGVIFIGIAAMLVRAAGVLLLSMSNVAGQLLAAVAFEAALPLADGLTPWLLAGAAIALLAVTIAALPSRRRG